MLFSQDSGLYHQVSVGLAPNTSVWPGDLSKCHAYYFVMVLDSIRIVIIYCFMDGTYTNFSNIPKPYNENLPEIMVHSIFYQVDLVLWIFTLIVSKEGTNMVYLSWWIGFETFHSFKKSTMVLIWFLWLDGLVFDTFNYLVKTTVSICSGVEPCFLLKLECSASENLLNQISLFCDNFTWHKSPRL